MGSGHGHGHRSDPDAPSVTVSPRTRTVLVVLVALVALTTLAGVVALWPRGDLRDARTAGAAPQVHPATVLQVDRATCPATPDDRASDGTPLQEVACGQVSVRLDGGPDAGTPVTVTVPDAVLTLGVATGDRVRVERLPPEAGVDGMSYIWTDFDRRVPLALLAVAFALLVVLVARWRGIAALAGLAVAFGMVVVFLIPALRHGRNPALVALVGAVAVMIVILYAAHGVSAKTTSALLGTVAGLVVTTGIAWWAAGSARLTGQTSGDAFSLAQAIGVRPLAGIVLASLVLAGLGVLNDVTVTQASAVWELHAAAPGLGPLALFRSGMRIGRDHLASTVYTIAFAYAAVSLQALTFLQTFGTPWRTAVLSGAVAQEVVGALVGGIGLILAIPLTTGVAALVVSTASPRTRPPGATSHRPDGDAVAATGQVPGPEAPSEFVEGVLVRRRRDRRRH